MDVVGSFIGVNRLEITHVAENGVFQSDSICSHQIACQAGRFQSDPHIIPLCHGGLAEVQLAFIFQARSEEHTSELQSLAYLVCRLLLEKKKKRPCRSNTQCTQPSR